MSGPPAGGALLDLLEPGLRRDPAADCAGAGGAGGRGRRPGPAPRMALARRWPACIVVAVAQVTARHDQNGKVWPAWHRATGSRASKRSGTEWAAAFLGSLAVLGVPPTGGDPVE